MRSARIGGRSSACALGIVPAHAASPSAVAATAENAGPVPTTDAMPPSTGPRRAPPTAAPIAMPISSPRRWRGEADTSHVSAPVQAKADPMPWPKRARSSSHSESPHPKMALVAARTSSPTIDVAFAPSLVTIQPDGIAATNPPAAYAATRIPEAVFESPRSSEY